MAPPSPSCFSKSPPSKDIAGDRAEPCGDASFALSLILSIPSSTPAPPPPSKGVIGEQTEPCVAASAPSPIPMMASSAPAPPPPPLLPPDFIEVIMGDVDDEVAMTIDDQNEKWEAMDQEQHVWNAIEEQQKLERQKKKQRQNTKKRRLEGNREEQREEKRKKRKNQEEDELQGKRKHVRSEFVQVATREELKSRDSPSRTHGQGVTRSPLVGSPMANTWRSSLGLLARVAASKKSSAMSPSPTTTSFVPRIRKTRRLTSAVWRDAKPIYHHNILVKAQCNHCHEVFPAGRGVGTNVVQRHLVACEKRLDLSLVVEKLKSSVSSPHGSML